MLYVGSMVFGPSSKFIDSVFMSRALLTMCSLFSYFFLIPIPTFCMGLDRMKNVRDTTLKIVFGIRIWYIIKSWF